MREINDFVGKAPAVNGSTDAAPVAECLREAADPIPSADPLIQQSTPLLCSCYDEETAKLQRKVEPQRFLIIIKTRQRSGSANT